MFAQHQFAENLKNKMTQTDYRLISSDNFASKNKKKTSNNSGALNFANTIMSNPRAISF